MKILKKKKRLKKVNHLKKEDLIGKFILDCNKEKVSNF